MRQLKILLTLMAVAGLVAVPSVGAVADEPVKTNDLDPDGEGFTHPSGAADDTDDGSGDSVGGGGGGGGGGDGYTGGGSGGGCSMFTPYQQTLMAGCS